jgi:hypothetical protein
VWQVRCNHEQKKLARGGLLALTTKALVFEPNRMDHRLGGVGARFELADIVEVGVEPPDYSPASGGMRSRLRLRMADDSTELLLVDKPDERAGAVRAAIVAAHRDES